MPAARQLYVARGQAFANAKRTRAYQQQQIGLLKQNLSQADAHLPAAREGRNQAVVVALGVEAERGHHLVDFAAARIDAAASKDAQTHAPCLRLGCAR